MLRGTGVAEFSDIFDMRPVDQGPKEGKKYDLKELIEKSSLKDNVPEWTIEGCLVAFCNEAVRRAELNRNGWLFESQYDKELYIDEQLPEILSKRRSNPDCQVSNKEKDKIDVPVLIVEVNSSPFIQTLKQTSIQLMNMLRYLRNFNLGILEYSGFAFPKLTDKPDAATDDDAKDKPDAATDDDAKDKPDAATDDDAKDKPDAATDDDSKDKPDAATDDDAKDKPDSATDDDAKDKPDAATDDDAKDKPDAATDDDAKDKPDSATDDDAKDKPDATTDDDAKDKPDAATDDDAKDKAYAAKVTVKWLKKNTKFAIVVDPLQTENVMEEMVRVLRINFDIIQNLPPEPPNKLTAIPLSGLPDGLKQIPSNYSLLLENENYFFKYPLEIYAKLLLQDLQSKALDEALEEASRKMKKEQEAWHKIEEEILAIINGEQQKDKIEKIRELLPKLEFNESNPMSKRPRSDSKISDSEISDSEISDSESHHQLRYLRPSVEKYDLFGVEYFKFPKLLKPLTEEQAKKCLMCFAKGVFAAIKQLHEHGYAHLDIHLPNVCIDPVTFEPVLIDLDRGRKCKEIVDPEMYDQSCMYDLPGANAESYDWRQFGLMLDWIQNDRSFYNTSYHVRNDLKNITDPFIKKLLKGEVPDQFDWVCDGQLTIKDVVQA